MARVPLVEPAELDADYSRLLTENSLGPISLFRALANNPEIMDSYMKWGTTLWEESGLTQREVELVILTVASELEAAYEWHQHVPIARSLGITDAEIAAVREGTFEPLDEAESVLCRYAAAVVDGDVDAAVYEDVAAVFDDSALVGITCLASHYLATAVFVDAVGVEPESTFRGWDGEGA